MTCWLVSPAIRTIYMAFWEGKHFGHLPHDAPIHASSFAGHSSRATRLMEIWCSITGICPMCTEEDEGALGKGRAPLREYGSRIRSRSRASSARANSAAI